MFGVDGILYALGTVVFVALVAFIKGRLDGAKLERAEQARQNARARDISDEIDDAVAGRSGDENRGRLKQWSKD
ncbi:hypothetical protein [Mesorhizobium marinum]|uniref:Uncharacterized protein n=1 Tax=Mesorhizobium marinum TaxID=3228790 RepID=A0ABV3R5L0_9HYPH